MPKQVLSFRIDEAELAALESLQQPGDTSLGQTALRLLRGIFGIQYTSVNAVNSSVNVGMVESAALDRELIRDEVEERTAYLATAMNEVKSQLENEIDSLKIEVQQVKAGLEELRSLPPQASQPQVKPKPTKFTRGTIPKETAIGPETTIQDVGLPQASRPLSASEMKSKVSSIARTLKSQGLKVSETIIKGKIAEMYPNSEDWISEDTRKDVIRALVKQPHN